MQSSGELKIEKVNVRGAELGGEVGKETPALCLLQRCPFSACPRTPGAKAVLGTNWGPLSPVSTPHYVTDRFRERSSG